MHDYAIRGAVCCAAALGAVACDRGEVAAQQATVSTPLVTTSDSFFEQIGVNWGLNFDNGFVRFGGPSPGLPPFGNPQPGAGLNFGVRGPGGFFNVHAAQGSRRSIVSQAPSVTLQNGVPGFISDSSLSPFVIGQIPIVGGAPAIPYSGLIAPPYGFGLYSVPPAAVLPPPPRGNWRVQQALRQRAAGSLRDGNGGAPPAPDDDFAAGLARRVSEPATPASRPGRSLSDDSPSTAVRPAPSLAEARHMRERQQAAAGAGPQKAQAYFERGLTAEQSGKRSVARIYYRMALRRAEGELRSRIAARLAELPELKDRP